MNNKTLRRVWVQIHLWLGLTLGVIGVLIGITGSLLIYQTEIDRALNPKRFATTGTDSTLTHAEYLERAAKALDGDMRAVGLRMPQEPGRPVAVLARGREASAGFTRVYLDPPTGEVLDVSRGGGFMGSVRQLHEYLMLRDYEGRSIVGAVGFGMLISSLSGLYLWWPGRARVRKSLGFARSSSLTRNLHYFFGFYCAVVLAMLSFTGIFLAFPEGGRNAVAALTAVSSSARDVTVTAENRGSRITPDEAAHIAREPYPNARVAALDLPRGPRGVYRVGLNDRGESAVNGTTVVFVDPVSRAVVRRIDASTKTSGDTFLTAQRTWHAGTPFGVAGRALLAFVGLLPALFVATGLTMWLRRR